MNNKAKSKPPTTRIHTQTLSRPDAKKHSVLFHELDSDKHPMFRGLYLMREAAKELLGVDDLDTVTGIRVTVEVVE